MAPAEKTPEIAVSDTELTKAPPPSFRSRDDRLAAGKALRATLRHQTHGDWKFRAATRRNPIRILEESNRGRLPELVPIRYGRMLGSPFTFLRGSAGLMAHDLAMMPTTGVRVQACGDCHLLNFGFFASPERNLIFDINDFDETLPAPWEWDVKRLAVSIAVAARENGHTDAHAGDAAVECARAYRQHLRDYSKKSPLDTWYGRLDEQLVIAAAPDAEARQRRKGYAAKAHSRVADHLFPKISEEVGGRRRLLDQPPRLFHVGRKDQKDWDERVHEMLEEYRQSLSDSVCVLFDGYRLQDFAVKVVGIGSVGTRCFVGLFFSPENHPLLLQFKEACASVLEPFAGVSRYANHGQRIVNGQRLMQSASDIFLGWARGRRGSHFYVRQLRDMKFSAPVEGATPRQLRRYGELCGWSLAHAHAKSGDSVTISGYLGKSGEFDQAIGHFALAYADQTARDHAALVAAVKAGRIKALVEEDD